MPDQYGDIPKGGTMRLGAYPCRITEGTIMERAYGTLDISERHRHRYEFNNDYRERFTEGGMVIAGTSPDGRLVEAVELPDHPHFVGVQYHPEFKSRPNKAHPLFREFIKAACETGGKQIMRDGYRRSYSEMYIKNATIAVIFRVIFIIVCGAGLVLRFMSITPSADMILGDFAVISNTLALVCFAVPDNRKTRL